MEFEDIKKPDIYLAFTGLGKTTYCKTHVGWIDLDEEFFLRTKTISFMPIAVKCYFQYGYKILSNASLKTILALRGECNLTIILPENTPEAKEFILNNVANRGYGKKYANWLKDFYDQCYKSVLMILKPEDKVIYLKAGEYISKYLDNC